MPAYGCAALYSGDRLVSIPMVRMGAKKTALGAHRDLAIFRRPCEPLLNVRMGPSAAAAWGRPWRDGPTGGEGAVYVACSTLCFARAPLARPLPITAELDSRKLASPIHHQRP